MREAAVMLIMKDGKILAISRRDDKTKFGLPGGKCEKNESPIQAAKRETLEETGVNVTNAVFIYKREEPRDKPEGEDFNCFCFYALEWHGEPQDSEEGHVVWMSEEELTGDAGAFSEYNKNTLAMLRNLYPGITNNIESRIKILVTDAYLNRMNDMVKILYEAGMEIYTSSSVIGVVSGKINQALIPMLKTLSGVELVKILPEKKD